MSGTDFVYNAARVRFARAQLDWTSAVINAMLVNSSYSPLPTHTHVSEISSGAIIARDVVLTANAVNSSGVCYGLIPTFSALLAAQPVIGLILYENTGDDTTSSLIYYSSGGVGFPFDAQGFDYTVGYDLTNGGFFRV